MGTVRRTAVAYLGGGLIASAAGNANGTLGDSREHLVLVEDAGNAVGHVQALEASKGKEGGIHDALIELPEAGLDVTPEVDDLWGSSNSSATQSSWQSLTCHLKKLSVIKLGQAIRRSLRLLNNLTEQESHMRRTFRVGYFARSWDWRRRAALPMVAPSGSSARLLYLADTNTSRVSSRGRLQGRMVPSGRYVGTSCSNHANHSVLDIERLDSCTAALMDSRRYERSKRQNCGYLHGVDSNVDAAIKESIVNLLGEQALASDVGQRLVQDLVAGGLDDLDLKSALLGQLREVLLQRLCKHTREQEFDFGKSLPADR